ncbi:MAG: 16S rRNA (cytosine(967)-C(5))-methyltransferase RsmB [Simkaniaceae bacterium]
MKKPSLDLVTKNPREAALQIAYLASRTDRYIADLVKEWENKSNPKTVDGRLVQEIVYGMKRREISLDYFCRKIPREKKKAFKGKERLIVHLSLYQYIFMSRIPMHAIVNESVKLANRYCHASFGSFLNAVLRKMPEINWQLPKKNWEVYFSYPKSLIALFIDDYPQKVEKILDAMNQTPKTMIRIRPAYKNVFFPAMSEWKKIDEYIGDIVLAQDSAKISSLGNRKEIYIQNITPAYLMKKLSQSLYGKPKKVLDLCAAPGGKLLMAHDLYPEAKLWANDISAPRIDLLYENCKKYGMTVMVSCKNAAYFKEEDLFDLVILDVPCSNSGVLHKRVEARYRITKTVLRELNKTQSALLKQAAQLIKKSGQIWYLTCSILKEENEKLVEKAAQDLGLSIVEKMYSVLPNNFGWDGGFACALSLKPSAKLDK